jgi:hypothetical protein
MALRCENCGVANPAINRFCGQCGRRLKQTALDTPEEFCRDTTGDPYVALGVSADLPPEVIEFDNQVPLLADEGTDRRTHATPGMLEQAHDHLEREVEHHDELQHGSELHSEVREREEAERNRRDDFLRWQVNPGDNGVHHAATYRATPTPAHRVSSPDREDTRRTGVSGPSFLGLSDDRVPENELQEYEELANPNSHLRRNAALVISATAVVLAVLQWRSIRDYGLPYVQNGSVAVRQLANGATRNSPAVAADNTGRDLGMTPGSPTLGTPQAVDSSPNAGHPMDVQQTTASRQPAPTASAPRATNAERPPAMSTPAADAPIAQPAPPASAERTPEPSPTRAAPAPVSRASAAPGVDEMNRAINSSDAEMRATWLWRAVGKGNPQAPVELARMYEQGNGVVRSCDQAKVLLRVAAAKGNEEARRNLQQIRIRGGCPSR